MALSNADILKRLCSIVCSKEETTTNGISKEEAMGFMESLLDKHNLEEKLKRVQIHKVEPKLAYHLRYALCFELLGHTGMIDRFCFDNSSRYAFSGSVDGLLKVWNIGNGMLVRTLYGHSSSINDITISASGEYLISADYQGVVCIWSLKTFKLLHMLRMDAEVMFCETFLSKPEQGAVETLGEIMFVCVLVNGVVRVVSFTEEAILSIKENCFMKGDSIKAICITDGGRFIICGGWWQFILIYDTHDLGGVYVLEEFRPQSLCASKNGLKIAASSQNNIYTYTFYTEGDSGRSNFKKKRDSRGYWRKTHHAISDIHMVERMCFLSSFLLVTVSSDNYVRVFDDSGVICSVYNEVGSIYAHPSRDIFAVVGTRLCMYEVIQPEYMSDDDIHSCCSKPGRLCINETESKKWVCLDYSKPIAECLNESSPKIFINKFFDEPLPISVNDCEFSGDGRYFITSDDRGVIRVFSVSGPISVPEQQFFDHEFSAFDNATAILDNVTELDNVVVNGPTTITLDSTAEIITYSLLYPNASVEPGIQPSGNAEANNVHRMQIFGEASFDQTVDVNRNQNAEWRKTEYEITPASTSIMALVNLEDLAAELLKKERLDVVKFNNLFISRDEEAFANDGSSGDETWASAYNSSNNSKDSDSDESSPDESISFITESSECSKVKFSPLLRKRGTRQETEEESRPFTRRNSRPRFVPEEISEESLADTAEEGSVESTLSTDTEGDNSSSQASSMTESSSSKVKLVNRKSNKKNVSQKRMIVSEDSSSAISSLGDYDDYQSSSINENLRTRKRLKNKQQHSNDDSQSSKKRSKRRIVHDMNSEDQEEPVVTLRRNFRGRDDSAINGRSAEDLSSEVNLRRTKRKLVEEEEASLEEQGIDVEFEMELARYSRLWLSTFSIYPQDSVYFDSEAYAKFIGLEGRLCRYDVPETGIYTVEAVHMEFIGRIPYLIVSLGDIEIAYYEYDKGTGILCLEEQWNAEGEVEIIDNCELVAITVGKTNGLLFKAKGGWFHRAFIAIHGNLQADPIEYDSSHRQMFGRQRGNHGNTLDIINYGVVNMKLRLNLYRSYDNFLTDLLRIKEAATKPHSKYAQRIYNSYC